MICLHDWRFENESDGSMYLVGTKPSGTRWETTQVYSLITHEDHYEVWTRNNIYVLFW